MTKIFYDTEFLEDGETIELISIGMIAEDGRELYYVNEEISGTDLQSLLKKFQGMSTLHNRICRHEWLMANVVPHLPLKPPLRSNEFVLDYDDRSIVPLRIIRNEVKHFVLSTKDPELWAYYGAYDHVVLCQLFGKMINLPEGFPMYTNDLKQEIMRLGNPKIEITQDKEHNALSDARWVKEVYEFLQSK